jgi:histone acetyltransferase (RNA polymerase elongator complex component)
MQQKWPWKELVTLSKRNYIIPVFVPHYGCGNDCVFCNQRKITGFKDKLDAKKYKGHIDKYLETIGDPQDKHIEIAFFGGSFTGLDMSLQREYLELALKYKEGNKINSIRMSTRPDYINREILDFLKEYSVDIIELGVQSMDERVLEVSKRGHDSEIVYRASRLIKDYDITLGIQIMVGLPEDSEEKFKETVDKVVAIKPDIVRIYPVLVIKNTELENMYLSGIYGSIEMDLAVKLSAYGDKKLSEKGIKVIRIGLQATDNISYDRDLVAGPFHPSFRQIVDNYHFLNSILRVLEKSSYEESKIDIYVNPKDISNVIGLNKKNRIVLEKMYKDIKIFGDNNIDKDCFLIKYGNETIMRSKYDY